LAKLKSMPNSNIISGLKGTVDFYYWKGIPVARQWPRSPGSNRSPSVKAQWPAWGAASKLWVRLSKAHQMLHGAWCGHGRYNPRDLQIKSYISGLYFAPDPDAVGNCQLLKYRFTELAGDVIFSVWLDTPWLPLAVWSNIQPRVNLGSINDRGLLVRNKPIIRFKGMGVIPHNYNTPSVFNSFTISGWPSGEKRWFWLYYYDGSAWYARSQSVPIPYTKL